MIFDWLNLGCDRKSWVKRVLMFLIWVIGFVIYWDVEDSKRGLEEIKIY